jgi:hypothetical protein
MFLILTKNGASPDCAQLTPPDPLPMILFVKRKPAGNATSLLLALTSGDLKRDADAAVALGATVLGRHERAGFQ